MLALDNVCIKNWDRAKVKGQPLRTGLIIYVTDFFSLQTLTEANLYVIPCDVLCSIATAKNHQIYEGFVDSHCRKNEVLL